jgi:hypothetical protein
LIRAGHFVSSRYRFFLSFVSRRRAKPPHVTTARIVIFRRDCQPVLVPSRNDPRNRLENRIDSRNAEKTGEC